MPDAPSTLSIAAAGFYGLVVLGCISAAHTSWTHRQQPWHRRVWVLAGLFFLFLIASRFLTLEEILRADLRGWLRDEGMNDDRREFQGVLIAGAIAGFVAIAMLVAFWLARRMSGRRNIAVALAAGSCAVMAVVIVLRMISLHAMDQLLYGPLKLNWLGDLGASAVVLGSAIYYALLVRGRIGRRAG